MIETVVDLVVLAVEHGHVGKVSAVEALVSVLWNLTSFLHNLEADIQVVGM